MGVSDSKVLSAAVIGAGFGRFHIHGLLAEPQRFTLKAVCDANVAAMQAVCNEMSLPKGCTTTTDYTTILNDPSIDAVFLSLPHHLHEGVAVEAARAGKHIMLDKPIARTLDEADRIIDAAHANNVTLMIAHQMRFYPPFRKLHAMITHKSLGRTIYAETRHYQNFNPSATSNWRRKASVGGGCVIGSGVHNIDMMRWFFGEPSEVFAMGVNDVARLDAEAAASIAFRFASGLVVNFTCNWAGHGALNGYEWGEWLVSCERGDISMRNGLTIGRNYGETVESVDGSDMAYESLWTHFANCIGDRTEPLISGSDARRTLALVLKVHESMASRKPVTC